MTATEIIAARIRKYTADLPSGHEGCECPSCVGARHTLKELEYLQMAVANLATRTLPAAQGADK